MSYINDTDIAILKTLERLGKTSPRELYFELILIRQISYTALRNHLAKLRKYGYVGAEGKGRTRRVWLTERGRRLLDEIAMLVMT